MLLELIAKLKRVKITYTIFILFLFSCKSNEKQLANTKWLTVKFTVDSLNYLTEQEKKALSEFDTSIKLYQDFRDSLVFTYVEGQDVDTSNYEIRDDTLFFINNNYTGTNIILKISTDSFITRRLAGSKDYAIRKH